MAKEGGDPLQFQPLAGGLDVGFLAELGHRKLNEFGLRDDAVEIRGSFSCAGQHNVRTPLSRVACGPSLARPTVPALLTRPAPPRAARLAAVRQRRRLRGPGRTGRAANPLRGAGHVAQREHTGRLQGA